LPTDDAVGRIDNEPSIRIELDKLTVPEDLSQLTDVCLMYWKIPCDVLAVIRLREELSDLSATGLAVERMHDAVQRHGSGPGGHALATSGH
jgi:hypothetical protein